MKDLHSIQIEILKRLLFSNGLRYAQIKPDPWMENSQFVFHLDKLIKEELIFKEGSFYTLTSAGKEFANRMDTTFKEFRPFPKTTTMLCGLRTHNGVQEILVYTRKKNPFYDFQGFPTQKVLFGDSMYEVAKNGFLEETGMKGEPTLCGIRHYQVSIEENQVYEDKIMYIFKFDNPEGELKPCDEGEYFWVNISDTDNRITNPLPEFKEALGLVLNFDGKITFKEEKQYLANQTI